MAKYKEDIDALIEQTLNSLDGMSKAEAGAFFYTRLSARLEGKNQQPVLYKFLKPALIAIVLVNMLSVGVYLLDGDTTADMQDIITEQYFGTEMAYLTDF